MKENISICPVCNGNMLAVRNVSLEGERNGELFTVTVPGLHCDDCGFETISNDQSGDFAKALSDAYRAKHGLLTGSEIRERRAALTMSQLQFAEYLGVGSSSVKRWECGQIQDRALDALIRLKTDPEAARGNLHSLESQLGRTTVIYAGADVDLSITEEQSWFEEETVGDWENCNYVSVGNGQIEQDELVAA